MLARILTLLAVMAASFTFAGLAKAGQPETVESVAASKDRVSIRRRDGDQLEISIGRGGTWQPVEKDGSVGAGWVVRWVEQGDRPWVLVERTDRASGEFRYVQAGGNTTRIRKLLGTVGKHSDPPPIVQYPGEFWDALGPAPNDILAERLLTQSDEDPTFEKIAGMYPPLSKPETFVGMKEYPHEVYVAADGSVAMDAGFFTGHEFDYYEYSPAIRFLLNGCLVSDVECETTMRRSLLDGYLPATQYLYRQHDAPVGWEQLVLMGRVDGKPGLFIRFRLVNLADRPQTVNFSIAPPAGGEFTLEDGELKVTSPLLTSRARVKLDLPEEQAAKTAMLKRQSLKVPLITSLTHSFEETVPVWKLELAAGQSQDLHLFLPGYCRGGAASLRPEQIAGAFYKALLDQHRSWADFVNSGTQIAVPDPGLEDIFKATLVRTLVVADGPGLGQCGALHYDNFWPFCQLHQARLMLDTGHPDYARQLLSYFLKERITDSGKFRFDFRQVHYQVFDVGEFLQVLARYYWYTGDVALLVDNKRNIDRVIAYYRGLQQQSMDRWPPGDPRQGMVLGSLNNDMVDHSYYYTNDGPIWEGLADYAAALEDVGRRTGSAECAEQAKELVSFNSAHFERLRASFESSAVERDGHGKVTFFHIHPLPADAQRPHTCTFLEIVGDRKTYAANRRFYDQPRLAASRFLTDDERRAFYRFQAEHDATILGVRRHRAGTLDDFAAFEDGFQMLRLGMTREYVMKYFTLIRGLLGYGTWSGFEQVPIRPPGDARRGRGRVSFARCPDYLTGYEGLHPTMVIPKLTKEMFAFDEPGGGAVWLAAGVPRHWLADGDVLRANHLPTRYGVIDLALRYDAPTRSLSIDIMPKTPQTIPEVRVRARDPAGGRLHSVVCETPQGKRCQHLPAQALVILKDVSGPHRVRVVFAGGNAAPDR